MTAATLAADLTAADRVRWAQWLLAPLVETARADAFVEIVAHSICTAEARQAGAPADICAERKEAQRAAVWRRDRLAGAVAELDGWLQAEAAAEGSVAA